MARIPNFPQRLMDEHARWHMNHMNQAVRPGDGISFLRFHRDFLRKSLQWYRSQGLDPRSVTPWTRIPSAVKASPDWTSRLQQAEDRITKRLGSFRSSDELGRYLLTSSLHDSMHVIGAEVYGDPDFEDIHNSPRSTLLYRWHGLIDRWWRKYQQLSKNRSTKPKATPTSTKAAPRTTRTTSTKTTPRATRTIGTSKSTKSGMSANSRRPR